MKCLDANPLALNIPCENAFKFFCKELLLRLDISNNNYFSCEKKEIIFLVRFSLWIEMKNVLILQIKLQRLLYILLSTIFFKSDAPFRLFSLYSRTCLSSGLSNPELSNIDAEIILESFLESIWKKGDFVHVLIKLVNKWLFIT